MLGLGAPFGGGFVLSYSWFALSVGFGRSAFAAVSSYHIIGSPYVLVSDNGPESVRIPFLAQLIGSNAFDLIASLVLLSCWFWTLS